MAIRKSIEETLAVDGTPTIWLSICKNALERKGFSRIEVDEVLGQLQASYRTKTIWGTLHISVLPGEGREDQTRLHLIATGNVDNIYALFRSPSRNILDEFKAGIVPPEMD
jgi:hypothetical protein